MPTDRVEADRDAANRTGLRLEQELSRLEAERALMTSVNEALARGDGSALGDLGVSEHTLAMLRNTDSGERPGYPDFALKMNAARIAELKRRLKARR